MAEPIDSEELSSLYAEAINGVAKKDSRFARRPGFSTTWDRAIAEIERIRREHPGFRIDLPI